MAEQYEIDEFRKKAKEYLKETGKSENDYNIEKYMKYLIERNKEKRIKEDQNYGEMKKGKRK